MNFSIFKRDTNKNVLADDNLENDEVFEVKDLYITTLGKVIETGTVYFHYELSVKSTEPIIVKRINRNRKVLDILNNIEYFHYYSNIKDKFLGCYMAGELKPLSMILMDKSKTTIRKSEILSLLYPKQEITTTNSFKDVVLKQIYETLSKVDKSSLEKERKDFLRDELVEIARNYVDILKSMSNSNSKVISLNVNHESIINLRKETMRKLVEIEMELPPEDIDNISNELMLLEQKIVKSK